MYIFIYVCTYTQTIIIVSNYGPGIYFIPATFTLAIKQDRHLLEDSQAINNL